MNASEVEPSEGERKPASKPESVESATRRFISFLEKTEAKAAERAMIMVRRAFKKIQDGYPKIIGFVFTTVPEIEPSYGERWVYNVRSRTKPNQPPYRVEVDSFNFNGSCTCPRFDFYCAKELSRGAKPSDDLRCYHITKARSYILDQMLPKWAAARDQAASAIVDITDVSMLLDIQQMIAARIKELTAPKPAKRSGRDYVLNMR